MELTTAEAYVIDQPRLANPDSDAEYCAFHSESGDWL